MLSLPTTDGILVSGIYSQLPQLKSNTIPNIRKSLTSRIKMRRKFFKSANFVSNLPTKERPTPSEYCKRNKGKACY